MKNISKYLSKRFARVVGMAMLMTLVFTLNSCIKDDKPDHPRKEEAEQNAKNANTESRTGQHVPVYADSTAIVFNTNPADTVETVFDLGNVDSIRYVSPPPYRDISYNGTYCWEYDITFYSGTDQVTRRAYAKYRGITYKQVPGSLEGLGTDFFYVNFIRTSKTIPYFDWGCTRAKFMHNYLIRKRENGEFTVSTDYLTSSNCNTNHIVFKKIFKR